MSYGSAKHEVFSARMQAFMVRLHDVIDREGGLLEDIYVNEAESGGHAAFVDNSIATKQEHIDGIVAIQAFATTLAAQLANVTPFLQDQ